MIRGQTIAVVVPAYNEEMLIRKTLTTMPDFVDAVIVINDGSSDRTGEVIREIRASDPRIHVVDHETNKGLGQSLIDGYVESRTLGYDVTAVMAGDAQMCPDDLEGVVRPIVEGEADYVKGNRLLVRDVAKHMPAYRLIGNSLLTILTKFATGYWHVIDPQCGYTAISRDALAKIPIEKMVRGYCYNADILCMLNIHGSRVMDVEVKPVYGDEQSKIRLHKYIPTVSLLLVRLFIRRMYYRCVVIDFNPVCLSYAAGGLLFAVGAIPLSVRLLWLYGGTGSLPHSTMLALMFVTIASLQILLSAVQYDMLNNRDICVKSRSGKFVVASQTASGDESRKAA